MLEKIFILHPIQIGDSTPKEDELRAYLAACAL